MVSHTNSYLQYRQLSQAHLDFVVVVCHAVPLLKRDLADPQATVSVAPNYFKTNSKKDLTAPADEYLVELSRTAFLTVFSYFEGYVKNTLGEIAKFHGGPPKLQALAMKRVRASMAVPDATCASSKTKLQEYANPAKADKYRKHTNILKNAGHRFPTELLSHYGVVNLLRKAKDDRDGMRAAEIPAILKDCFCYPLSEQDEQVIIDARIIRNKIAHGKAPSVTLQSSMKMASDLRAIAVKVDGHIVDHFLVIQQFA